MNKTRNESADIAAGIAEKHTGKSRRNGLEPYNLKRLNQAEISNMNRSINSSEIESVKKKKIFSSKQNSGTEFHQTFKKELTIILLKLFQKIKEEGTLINSFNKATITLIPKPDKDTTKKLSNRQISKNIGAEILKNFYQTKFNNI